LEPQTFALVLRKFRGLEALAMRRRRPISPRRAGAAGGNLALML
jgi:hypothetical protein